MITTEKAVYETRPNTKDASLLLSLVLVLFLATLTLWIPAYWPVALFESSAFTIAGVALVLKKRPGNGTQYPLFCLSFVVLWGCLQLITGWSVHRFATERATLQWMTWAAVYYAGVSISQDESVAKRLRTVIVWSGFAVSVEAILQAYLSPGNAYGLFPTGYHDFVMGPIVYHTHFAAFIETILPHRAFLALNEAKEYYPYLGISARSTCGGGRQRFAWRPDHRLRGGFGCAGVVVSTETKGRQATQLKGIGSCECYCCSNAHCRICNCVGAVLFGGSTAGVSNLPFPRCT